jgi:hypothetical protein
MFESFEPDNQIDKKRVARNAAIARLAKFIEKHLYNTDWTLLADAAGVGHILDRYERVRRAQSFGDPDYPSAVSRFLKDVFNSDDEQIGLFLVGEIIRAKNDYDEPLTEDAKGELNQILSMFGSEGIETIVPIFPPPVVSKFIEVVWIPDDFYEKLIDEINRAYAYQMPMALSITVRKLLENLVIDILRKKYGTAHLELYYNPSRRRFNDFSVLLQNLDAKKGDFHYISSSLDRSFISDLNRYRETGNSGAHSIDTNLTIEQFAADKDKINYLVRLLLRVFRRL